MRRPIVAGALVVAMCGGVRAEMWPSLERYVSDCVLIVKAKTVDDDAGNRVTFRVQESWKGKYHPDLLKNTTPDGRFSTYRGEHGVDVADGQEIVFFFTRYNNPTKGPLKCHSTSFPVKDGKVVYASTAFSLAKEYDLAEFKKTILAMIERQRKDAAKRENADVGNIYETTAKLPEDRRIWPIPEIETTKDIFAVDAEFVESKEILSVTQGNWRKVTYLVQYKVTEKDERYPYEEISFIAEDAWPVRESGIKVKRLGYPFQKGRKFFYLKKVERCRFKAYFDILTYS